MIRSGEGLADWRVVKDSVRWGFRKVSCRGFLAGHAGRLKLPGKGKFGGKWPGYKAGVGNLLDRTTTIHLVAHNPHLTNAA